MDPSCGGTWASVVRLTTQTPCKDDGGERPSGRSPPRAGTEPYFFGAFGSLGLLGVLELSLGFIVLSPVPGALEVSVVEPVCVLSTGPVAGAAGRA